jgi:formate hydrogenlyase transcriptional activator
VPFIAAKLTAGEVAWFTGTEEVPDPVACATLLAEGIRSAAFVPVTLPGEAPGVRRALSVASTTRACAWPPATLEALRSLALLFGHALARRANVEEVQWALDELERIREQDERASEEIKRLRATAQSALDVNRADVRALRSEADVERMELRRDVRAVRGTRLLAIDSPAAQQVLAQVQQVAPTTATVLMLGETGSGKEVFAEALHELSPRRHKTMIRVNCAAIPTSLIESEMFGRERGAYTGALSRQIGRFEAADGSTLFLDEVGELPLDVQVKLLRVLQDRVIERLGSSQPIKVNVRVIAATNRDLEQAVADKTFREDL